MHAHSHTHLDNLEQLSGLYCTITHTVHQILLTMLLNVLCVLVHVDWVQVTILVGVKNAANWYDCANLWVLGWVPILCNIQNSLQCFSFVVLNLSDMKATKNHRQRYIQDFSIYMRSCLGCFFHAWLQSAVYVSNCLIKTYIYPSLSHLLVLCLFPFKGEHPYMLVFRQFYELLCFQIFIYLLSWRIKLKVFLPMKVLYECQCWICIEFSYVLL